MYNKLKKSTNSKLSYNKFNLKQTNKNDKNNIQTEAILISSQNVRSFGMKKLNTVKLRGTSSKNSVRQATQVKKWCSSWKERIMQQNIDVIMVQETHIGDADTKLQIQKAWGQVWGLKDVAVLEKLSYFSTSSSSAKGVGVFVSPHSNLIIKEVKFCKNFEDRAMIVRTEDWTLVNIYAPNQRQDRENFFKQLSKIKVADGEKILLAGDFNCTRMPHLDRISSTANYDTVSESPKLDKLIVKWRLLDAVFLVHDVPTNPRDLLKFQNAQMTCIKARSASRIDRMYLSENASEWVAAQKVTTPAEDSDHRRMNILLRDPEKN